MKLTSLEFHIPTTHRALGMFMNINQDKLTFKPIRIEIALIQSVVFYHCLYFFFDLLEILTLRFLESQFIIEKLRKLMIS